MVMKSEHSDHRLQAYLYGETCQAHLSRVESDLAQEYPVAFKRDLLVLIEALARFVDDSIVSPRLLYPSPSDPITYLCLAVGQDPELAGRLLDYLKAKNYYCFDAGINLYNALIKRLSLALDAPYLSRIALRSPSPSAGLEYAVAKGKLLEANVTFSASQLAELDMKQKRVSIKTRVEITDIADQGAVYGMIVLNTKSLTKSRRYVLTPNGTGELYKGFELSYPLADLGPYARADLGLIIQVRGHESKFDKDGHKLKEKFSQLTLPLSANLVFPKE